MWPFARKKATPEERQTAIGVMYGDESTGWLGSIEVEGREIAVHADDVRGEPDPILLEYLANSRGKIPGLERLARAALYGISDEHEFSSISSSRVNAVAPITFDGVKGEICLIFDYDMENGAWGESVFVHFKDGKIIHYDSSD